MTARDDRVWGAFGLLGLSWGSSFLFIKLGLNELPPFTLVSLRLAIGLAGFFVFMRVSRSEFPRDGRVLGKLALLGVFNPALPFLLITWGQQFTTSAIGGILNGTVPLFSMIFAHMVLASERFTSRKVAGLLVGFLGVILIFGQGLLSGAPSTGLRLSRTIQGQLAMVGAAMAYGATAVYVKRSLQDVSPIVVAAGSQVAAFVVVAASTLVVEGVALDRLGTQSLGSVLWLGLVGTTLAYILNFYIIREWGATRATMVTYLIPVVAFVLGAVILKEPVTWNAVLGGVMILSAIIMVNRKAG
jgi:drug/metabolite transporter (DMT)-like permease